MPITHLPLSHLLASTDPAEFSGRRTLSDVNVRVVKARKVLVVSGAGISCSSGIPDFRSENGLYSLVKGRYPDAFVSGKDLFSSGLFAHPTTAAIFYTFIAELSLACQAAEPTRTHHFIRRLESKGKLLRSYTQNVDGLERRMGIESGGRGAGLKKNGTRNVELHGDLGRVRCVLCYTDYEARVEWIAMFREGEAPGCPACNERCMERLSRSARATPIGSLRPSIVLYDEPHPLGDQIGELQTHDMRRGPDVLLIMGTSLKVHGLKRLVKDFARVVHDKKGIVVFVNATSPSKEWDSVIDYHIEGETDRWVERVEEEWKRVRPQDWELQTVLDKEVVHGTVAKTKAKPRAKPKAKAVAPVFPLPEDEISHLPTPPASQLSPRSDSYTEFFSSPLSSCPPSPVNERTPRATPPTPDSPSKRTGGNSIQNQTVNKKTKLKPEPPSTGMPSTPGSGNLFAESSKLNCEPSKLNFAPRAFARTQSDSAAMFGASKSRAGARTRAAPKLSFKAAATTSTAIKAAPIRRPSPPDVVMPSVRRRSVAATLSAVSDDKENAPPPPRGMRRTASMAV
ncbi:uncharacterized protein EHS24_005065 [Apiotrichum porosum]|uniref:Deacetylase sirtuin-type domain-containing protein n=1 Tax=Apiotrichum porosum TaxID=105984 RepID=A0A427Y6S0_9TREE|nr:uncharacterized protein EHS24_005065 [Apiotrichum porosum]RSH86793.1 hypothetical protein EHS24_005065 [Apiotrichum porosum]